MKRFLSLLFAMGAFVPAIADFNAVARSQRNFRIDPTTGIALADIVVAYQQPPTALTGLQTVDQQKALLFSAFTQASKDLFQASKGAVQLGRITLVPYTVNGVTNPIDPDVVVLADKQDATTKVLSCPDDLAKSNDVVGGVTVCADANTGGFLGLKWWSDVLTPTPGNGVVFDRITIANSTAANPLPASQGARVAISWNTLNATGGVTTLTHEFGHYLFGMRDEYQAQTVLIPDETQTGQEIYEGAAAQAPSAAGIALGGVAASSLSTWDVLTRFKGYAMSTISGYKPLLGYSPAQLKDPLPATLDTPFPTSAEEFESAQGKDYYVFTEQVANTATRGKTGNQRNYRNGCMWSLETAIRTGLGGTYTLVSNVDANGNTDMSKFLASQTTTDYYVDGEANIFVLDRSYSMKQLVTSANGQPVNVSRWDAAVDFLGRLTHPGEGDGNKVSYRSDAKFGLIAFDDVITPIVNYPSDLSAVKAYTAPYQYATASRPLAWVSNSSPYLPAPEYGSTNLVGALALAQSQLDNAVDANNVPLHVAQRNVILLSDGQHNTPDPKDFHTKLALNGRYRLFAVYVDKDISDKELADTLQKLALRSVGTDGAPGDVCYSDGNDQADATGNAVLTACANKISDEISLMDVQTVPASTLYRDAARSFPISIDRTQTRVHLSVAWSGSYVPTTTLSGPNNQTFAEGSYTGIVFRQSAHYKTYDIDLTKFSMDPGADTVGWKLNVSAPQSANPITIYPSISAKSPKVLVNAVFDPSFVNTKGRLPVTVTVQDGRAIEGLAVTATLANRATGVTRNFNLNWNGTAYVGTLSGNLQAGVNDLFISVVYPKGGKVYFAKAENDVPDNQRTIYPYFTPRKKSMEVWVGGAAATKSMPGLEVRTLNTSVAGNAQGTNLKLFVKNNTQLTFNGLSVRYFYSVSEFDNGVPGINVNYLPQSKVSYGTVTGRPGLAYVQFDFAQTIKPGDSTSNGSNGGENVTLIENSWRAPFNTSNDWSAQGLASTWSANNYVNIYDASGVLLAGNPELERRMDLPDASPVVSLSPVSDLIAVGSPAAFTANALDPEGENLTYTWTVDGIPVAGNPGQLNQMVQTFSTSGNHTVTVTVADGVSTATVVSIIVTVQAAAGACTGTQNDLGTASSNKVISLTAGTNCFVIPATKVSREWTWSNIVFQANSDNGVALTGISVQQVSTGTATSLAGYSQNSQFADPGRGKNLYLKLQSSTARSIRTNWWLQ